jgi:NitT/TauT family transport system substrate-binding protein
MSFMKKTIACAVGLAGILWLAGPALAQDTLKMVMGQINNWENQSPTLGQEAGIYKKHNIVVDMTGSQGAGETIQAVISGSADLGGGVGVAGALRAMSKGAPIRILLPAFTGTSDLYWYVKADSPIKSLKDTEGKILAYSTNGSSTHGIVTAFMKQYDLKAKPTAVGGPAVNLTAVMSGQIDVGWSAPPFGLDQLDKGEIRIIASGSDADVFKGQTVRVNIANADYYKSNRDVIVRYMKAYRETIDCMYKEERCLKAYAEWLNISEAKAKRTRDEFFPGDAINPDRVVGLDTVVKDAVDLKFTAQPLNKDQLADLIQIPPR